MDEAEFAVKKLQESLDIHEAAIADLSANGASPEVLLEVRHRRDCYAQCLNMMAGPVAAKKKNHRCW